MTNTEEMQPQQSAQLQGVEHTNQLPTTIEPEEANSYMANNEEFVSGILENLKTPKEVED